MSWRKPLKFSAVANCAWLWRSHVRLLLPRLPRPPPPLVLHTPAAAAAASVMLIFLFWLPLPQVLRRAPGVCWNACPAASLHSPVACIFVTSARPALREQAQQLCNRLRLMLQEMRELAVRGVDGPGMQ